MKPGFAKFILFVLWISVSGYAQSQPFIQEIREFRKQDSAHFPARNAILFVGSSSFTKWKDLQDYFPGYPVINRGFGGSSLPDLIRYADQIIFPYHAKQVVIYCGENDLAAADTVSAETVFARFRTLFQMIRKNSPGQNIVFISIKPSPSRASKMPKEVRANELIKDYLSHQEGTSFVNVYDRMLLPNGRPIPEIFLQDSLHMNAKGYAIWKKEIQPFLIK